MQAPSQLISRDTAQMLITALDHHHITVKDAKEFIKRMYRVTVIRCRTREQLVRFIGRSIKEGL
jgi:hypothetical protein